MKAHRTAKPASLAGLAVAMLVFSQITHAEDNAAYKKIHRDLMKDVERAIAGERVPSVLGWTQIEVAPASKDLLFTARIRVGADLSSYATQWFARPFVNPDGTTVASGFASPEGILEMAHDPTVISLQRATSAVNAPQPPDPELDQIQQPYLRPRIRVGEASP